MDAKILQIVEKDQYKKLPDVRVGDTVKLHMKIKEGSKERIQIFEGIVLSIQGSGLNKSVTVRKISMGVGVERIVPLHAPTLDKIEITKRGTVRRSKLYFMRGRIGKAAMKVNSNVRDYAESAPEESVEEMVEVDAPAVAEETAPEEVIEAKGEAK